MSNREPNDAKENARTTHDCWECGAELRAQWMEDVDMHAGKCPDCGIVTHRKSFFSRILRVVR